MTADYESELVEPVEPAEPIAPTEPVAAAESVESTQLAESVAPAESTQLTESTQPVESVAPPQEPVADHGISAGDPRIAEAVDRLRELAGRPPEEHVEVYEAVHRVLHEALADVEPGDPDPGQDAEDSPA